jgi:hypothetical protein
MRRGEVEVNADWSKMASQGGLYFFDNRYSMQFNTASPPIAAHNYWHPAMEFISTTFYSVVAFQFSWTYFLTQRRVTDICSTTKCLHTENTLILSQFLIQDDNQQSSYHRLQRLRALARTSFSISVTASSVNTSQVKLKLLPP